MTTTLAVEINRTTMRGDESLYDDTKALLNQARHMELPTRIIDPSKCKFILSHRALDRLRNELYDIKHLSAAIAVDQQQTLLGFRYSINPAYETIVVRFEMGCCMLPRKVATVSEE